MDNYRKGGAKINKGCGKQVDPGIFFIALFISLQVELTEVGNMELGNVLTQNRTL